MSYRGEWECDPCGASGFLKTESGLAKLFDPGVTLETIGAVFDPVSALTKDFLERTSSGFLSAIGSVSTLDFMEVTFLMLSLSWLTIFSDSKMTSYSES